jgi:Arc/MetJ family transcription regulator
MNEPRGYRAQPPAPRKQKLVPLAAAPEASEPQYPQQRWYRAYSQADDDAVAAIMTRYGLASKEDAIRLALRMAAGDAIKITTIAAPAKRLVVEIKATDKA